MSRKKDHIERARQLIGENAIEIPFGAIDSELCGWEYTIPEGMEAVVKDGKVIVRRKESEDECIRKELIQYLKDYPNLPNGQYTRADFFAYLEKLKDSKMVKFDHDREQKPAEEDKTNGWTGVDLGRYLSCLQHLGTGNPLQPETINSKWFKEHCRPQPHWKPSEEQPECLADVSKMELEVDLEKAARHVYESWMGGTMDDVRRDMAELGRVINARKEQL